MTTGKARVEALSTYGYEGIKAATSKTVIAASLTSAVYVANVQAPGVSIVLLPKVNDVADSMLSAQFISDTEVKITTQLGKIYTLNLTSLILI